MFVRVLWFGWYERENKRRKFLGKKKTGGDEIRDFARDERQDRKTRDRWVSCGGRSQVSGEGSRLKRVKVPFCFVQITASPRIDGDKISWTGLLLWLQRG